MSYINTGVKRSLTFQVMKEVNGVLVTGYPKTYNGKLAFTYGGVTYPLISSGAMAMLSTADYLARLAAFEAYVALSEPGLNFTTDITAGFEPYKTDLSDCPLPVTTTITTLPPTTTTTTTTASLALVNLHVDCYVADGVNNGMEGTIDVCGQPILVPEHTRTGIFEKYIAHDTICEIDFASIISKESGITIPDFRYFRLTGITDWVEFTSDNFFNILAVSGTDVINIEVSISNVAIGIVTTTSTSTTTSTTTTTIPVTTTVTTLPGETTTSTTTEPPCYDYELSNDTDNITYFDVVDCSGNSYLVPVDPHADEHVMCLRSAVDLSGWGTATILYPCEGVSLDHESLHFIQAGETKSLHITTALVGLTVYNPGSWGITSVLTPSGDGYDLTVTAPANYETYFVDTIIVIQNGGVDLVGVYCYQDAYVPE